MNGNARIFAGGSYVSSVLVAPPVGDTTPSSVTPLASTANTPCRSEPAASVAAYVARREVRRPPRAGGRDERDRLIGVVRELAARGPRCASRRCSRGRPCSTSRRSRSGTLAIWPAISGTSCASITPSWFGVHSAVVPSLPGASLPSVIAASTSAAPQVPSALQKWRGHWSSVVQRRPAAAAARRHAAEQHKQAAQARVDMAGTLRLARSSCQALFCSAAKSRLALHHAGPGKVRPWRRS